MTTTYATDSDPLPARPLPADLAVLPVEEMAHSYAVYARLALTGSPADGGELALDALAYAAAVLTEVSSRVGALATAARLAGASPRDIAARLPGGDRPVRWSA